METIFTDSFSVVIDRQHPLARRKFLDIEEILDYKLILHKYDFTVAGYSAYFTELSSELQTES